MGITKMASEIEGGSSGGTNTQKASGRDDVDLALSSLQGALHVLSRPEPGHQEGKGERGGFGVRLPRSSGGQAKALEHSRRCFKGWRAAFEQHERALQKTRNMHWHFVRQAAMMTCGPWFAGVIADVNDDMPEEKDLRDTTEAKVQGAAHKSLPYALQDWLEPCFERESVRGVLSKNPLVQSRYSWLTAGSVQSQIGPSWAWRRKGKIAARNHRWSILDSLAASLSLNPEGGSVPVDAGGPSNLDGVTTAAADTDARLANSGEKHAKDEAKDNGASGAWWKRLRCVAAEKLASLRGGMVSVGTAREASGTSHGMASPRGGGGEILKQLVFAALVQNALCQALTRLGMWRCSVILVLGAMHGLSGPAEPGV